ncbi:MAG: Formate dehydrogenase, cytochrome b556(fdo) subunit [Gammaproteobacteria bacterium]|nr:Formate dehydrogenase, cytochrome b556(fdo) subunit [Gammaproteobacteria bacterium]
MRRKYSGASSAGRMPVVPGPVNKRINFLQLIPALAVTLVVGSLSLVLSPPLRAEEAPAARQIQIPNPASDLWREVRGRTDASAQNPDLRDVSAAYLVQDLWTQVRSGSREVAGRSQVQGVDAGVLINTPGEQWRRFRMSQLVPYSAYLLGGILIVLAAFRLLRGKIPISSGRSGVKIPRFSLNQRTVHWIVAITFVSLALTGAILVFGRFLLIPLIGANGFSYVAITAKRIHDFAGPVFGVALVVQFFLFVRGNLPSLKSDILWVLKGGGLFGSHASANCYNAGEKLWFWVAMLGGFAIVISGLIMDFPIFDQGRATMQLVHVIHSITAMIVLAVALGHIYLGTIGTEGSFEVMASGYCDENWAKEHHDMWHKKMEVEGKVGVAAAGGKEKKPAATKKAVPAKGT